jgi:hypothetical protein
LRKFRRCARSYVVWARQYPGHHASRCLAHSPESRTSSTAAGEVADTALAFVQRVLV